MTVKTSTSVELAFGAEPYVQALKARIDRHFVEGGENPAFVAGIFGEWGSGKTRWLERLVELFHQTSPTDSVKTLPVFFNAWRYEREHHIVVPLLKTAEQAVRAAAGEPGKIAKSGKWLVERAEMLKDSACALASGFKGKLTLPLLAEAEFSPQAMLESDQANQERRKKKDAQASVLAKYESIYFDLQTYLRTITGHKGDGPKLNLVFLIDDVDRCLPEKAVEVLEAIKLFLEVEGCAFLLGLDEEVVSRGILHRYRDYMFDGNKSGNPAPSSPPITGHEYLEKIIHLPVRVPAVELMDARKFLTDKISPSLRRIN